MWTIKVEDSREYNDERERELPPDFAGEPLFCPFRPPLYPFLLALAAFSALLGL